MNAPASAFQFKIAVREQVSLLIALAGASGSGKTYSALLLAQGMSPSGKIAFIDTEARRGLHYADKFQFMHADMRPPFRPASFIKGIKAAEAAGMEVLIIDSFSHEWDGIGGIADWAAEIENGIPKPGIENPRAPFSDPDWWKDWKVKPFPGPGAWKEPKKGPEGHHWLINTILQARLHLIFCLRADERIKIAKENGKTVIVPLGWQPICEKRFMYEMTTSFTLTPDSPGVPHFDLPHKLQDQHRSFFPEGKRIGVHGGQMLAEWARGGPVEPKATPASTPVASDILADGNAQAAKGTEALKAWWQNVLTKAQRLALKNNMPMWKVDAEQADISDVSFDESAPQGASEPTGERQHEGAAKPVEGGDAPRHSKPKDGGVIPPASPSGPDDDDADGFPGDGILHRARAKSMHGRKAFDKWLGGLSEGDHASLKLNMGGLIAAADAADGRA